MDETTPVSTPNLDAAPEVTSGAPGAPDISALGSPAPAPTLSDAVTENQKPYAAGMSAASQKISDLSQPAPPAPPVPHARLLSMIQGLALGISAFGDSLATKGREGGMKEVAQVRGEQQQQKIAADAAAAAKKNQQIQQQIQVFDTNQKMYETIANMASLPNKIRQEHLAVTGAEQQQSITGADFQASHGGMSPEKFKAALDNTAPVSGTPNSFFTTNAQQQLQAATTVLGPDDPFVKNMQTVLKDPNANASKLWQATWQLQTQQSRQADAMKQKAEAGTAQSLNIAAQEKAGALQAYNESGAAKRGESFDVWEASQKSYNEAVAKVKAAKDADQDDLKLVAKALLDPQNLTALKDVASMRGDQRIRLFEAADKMSMAAGTGHFSPGVTNQRIKFIGEYEDPKGRAATNRQAINNVVQHAADLADINKNYGRTDERFLNTPINKLKQQFGDTAYTKFSLTNSVLKDELSLYFAGGYAPSGDQAKMWDKIQNDSATPSQTETFAKDIVHLAARRASTFNSGFKTNMGYDDPNMITPDAKAAAARLGVADELAQFGSGGVIGQPQAAPKALHQPGDKVTLKSGQQVVIKTIDPKTGTFTY